MKKSAFVILIILILQLLHCSSRIIKEPLTASNDAWSVTIREYTAGPDEYHGTMNAYRGRSGTAAYYPPKNEGGLLWMKVSVVNTSPDNRVFKFNRIRLVANTYIASAKNVFSHVPFAEEGSVICIKPGTEIERWVLFTYEKKFFPYKFVYDDCLNNTIIDKISIDLPEHAP